MNRYRLGLFTVAALAVAFVARFDAGDPTKSESKVKASVEGSKVENDTQTFTVSLKIEKGWHLYANPVNHEFLKGAQTKVNVKSKEKISEVSVKYPAGKTFADKDEKYNIYEGTVKIPVSLKRTAGDKSPLEVSIYLQACDSGTCLQNSTIKLTVK